MLVSALIETSAPICIERWDDYKMLGRFTLRDEGEWGCWGGVECVTDLYLGKTVAIGKVTKLIEKAEDMPNVASLSLNAT